MYVVNEMIFYGCLNAIRYVYIIYSFSLENLINVNIIIHYLLYILMVNIWFMDTVCVELLAREKARNKSIFLKKMHSITVFSIVIMWNILLEGIYFKELTNLSICAFFSPR